MLSVCVVLVVLLVFLFVACAIISTTKNDIIEKYNELRVKYDSLTSDYEALDNLYDSYVKLSEGWASKSDIVFEAMGKQILAESNTAVLGEVVAIGIPYTTTDNAFALITPWASTLREMLSTSEYKTCIVFFVDGDGECRLGFNFSKTGNVTYFSEQK